jgi:hypothetical protein
LRIRRSAIDPIQKIKLSEHRAPRKPPNRPIFDFQLQPHVDGKGIGPDGPGNLFYLVSDKLASLLANDPNAGQFAIEPWSDAARVNSSLARLGGDQKSEQKKHFL